MSNLRNVALSVLWVYRAILVDLLTRLLLIYLAPDHLRHADNYFSFLVGAGCGGLHP